MSFDVKVEQVLCLINVQLARSFVVIVDQVSLAVQINNYFISSESCQSFDFNNSYVTVSFDVRVDQVPFAV